MWSIRGCNHGSFSGLIQITEADFLYLFCFVSHLEPINSQLELVNRGHMTQYSYSAPQVIDFTSSCDLYLNFSLLCCSSHLILTLSLPSGGEVMCLSVTFHSLSPQVVFLHMGTYRDFICMCKVSLLFFLVHVDATKEKNKCSLESADICVSVCKPARPGCRLPADEGVPFDILTCSVVSVIIPRRLMSVFLQLVNKC